jgi:hypothetical protein
VDLIGAVFRCPALADLSGILVRGQTGCSGDAVAWHPDFRERSAPVLDVISKEEAYVEVR